MALNSKKLELTSKIIYYSISFILCLFLILLSNRIIDDLDTATVMPQYENFGDGPRLAELQRQIAEVNNDLENLYAKQSTVEIMISIAKENYANEQQSFDNWVQTRETLGSPDKDQEVIDRARRLDELYKVEQGWRLESNARQIEIDSINKALQSIQLMVEEENRKAEIEYFDAIKSYDLKVFLIRLLFVTPVLALGIFFFVRYRNHKFWPLFFGFSLFSMYAFFFGLVPYLPSYGGYVRYAVGILLSAGLGYYAIRSIRRYIEQKQAELKTSTQERAKNVRLEVAEKALENHYCPSCGKDFIIKRWETPLKPNENEMYKLVTDFCRHCGLELFSNCKNCGNKNFAHLLFCASCGTKTVIEN